MHPVGAWGARSAACSLRSVPCVKQGRRGGRQSAQRTRLRALLQAPTRPSMRAPCQLRLVPSCFLFVNKPTLGMQQAG